MNIKGLTYKEDFISPETENELIKSIDAQPWRADLKRRVQHYGYRYDYTKRAVDSSMYLGEIPSFLSYLKDKVAQHFDQVPDQAIVNEYLPGQGIGKHIDCVTCFGPTVASLSLLSPCVMSFSSGKEYHEMWLDPGSLLVLSGEARYDWTHYITGRQMDFRDDKEIVRGRRISITFRTVIIHG